MVEELTQYVNRCEYQLNELYDEAEDLRERLGLDPKKPLCIEGATHRRGLNIMKDKSLNRVLQKEVGNWLIDGWLILIQLVMLNNCSWLRVVHNENCRRYYFY